MTTSMEIVGRFPISGFRTESATREESHCAAGHDHYCVHAQDNQPARPAHIHRPRFDPARTTNIRSKSFRIQNTATSTISSAETPCRRFRGQWLFVPQAHALSEPFGGLPSHLCAMFCTNTGTGGMVPNRFLERNVEWRRWLRQRSTLRTTEIELCLKSGAFTAASVMIRKAVEVAIILRFEQEGRLGFVTSDKGDTLSFIEKIDRAQSQNYMSPQRAKELKQIKSYGDSGAHSYKIVINQDDIQHAMVLLRLSLGSCFQKARGYWD